MSKSVSSTQSRPVTVSRMRCRNRGANGSRSTTRSATSLSLRTASVDGRSKTSTNVRCHGVPPTPRDSDAISVWDRGSAIVLLHELTDDDTHRARAGCGGTQRCGKMTEYQPHQENPCDAFLPASW